MPGDFERIGTRETYFPPFVNERFGNKPYWACTFASLLNGVNVGSYGTKPATPHEVRRLAHASGDQYLHGGSNSTHMVRALKAVYGYDRRIVSHPTEKVQARLASGWAMVAGVWYGKLPTDVRHGSFTGGHRVVVLGWDGKRTRILDPLQPKGPDFHGLWVTWKEFANAWWSSEQLWFKEGCMLPAPKLGPIRAVDPVRTWTGRKDAVLTLRDAKSGAIVKRIRLEQTVNSRFDAVARLIPPAGSLQQPETLIRLAGGRYAGLLTNGHAPGVQADTTVISDAVLASVRSAARRELWGELEPQILAGQLPKKPADIA